MSEPRAIASGGDDLVETGIISGIDAQRGIGAAEAQGFWADAWSRVCGRRGAMLALAWIGVIAFLAIFAPLVANGHPLIWTRLDATGAVVARSSPLWNTLTAADLLLMLGAIVGAPWLALRLRTPRATRLQAILVGSLYAGFIALFAAGLDGWFASPDRAAETREIGRAAWFPWAVVGGVALALFPIAAWSQPFRRAAVRCAAALVVAALATICVAERWQAPFIDFDTYAELESSGAARGIYTIVPWSPTQARPSLNLKEPGTRLGDVVISLKGTAPGERRFWLGTDNVGCDVLSKMIHACRLSISIGLVSTGIAVLIGVTMGAVMGYFGGKIDLVLFRVVEVFMAIPVLFLLIVAAGVLPRNTYVMMVIIGCVTWTGAARFTRAEFLKLRNQDFVQAARAAGLPLRSILFRHMLPNGVTPVLVDASFSVAAAVTFEATLSFLGLGPDDQASWGQLLSSATSSSGLFKWWLATFPGYAIFLCVLSYNVLGEALRDAIDPKLRKAGN